MLSYKWCFICFRFAASVEYSSSWSTILRKGYPICTYNHFLCCQNIYKEKKNKETWEASVMIQSLRWDSKFPPFLFPLNCQCYFGSFVQTLTSYLYKYLNLQIVCYPISIKINILLIPPYLSYFKLLYSIFSYLLNPNFTEQKLLEWKQCSVIISITQPQWILIK